MQFALTLQSVELVLESDSTVEEPHGHPVLALNVSAEVTLADFIGKDVRATYITLCTVGIESVNSGMEWNGLE